MGWAVHSCRCRSNVDAFYVAAAARLRSSAKRSQNAASRLVRRIAFTELRPLRGRTQAPPAATRLAFVATHQAVAVEADAFFAEQLFDIDVQGPGQFQRRGDRRRIQPALDF